MRGIGRQPLQRRNIGAERPDGRTVAWTPCRVWDEAKQWSAQSSEATCRFSAVEPYGLTRA
jgi:hypothetical protein